MKINFHTWIEEYLFFPTPMQKILSIVLLPLTMVYCIYIALKRAKAKPQSFGINVVSVGNLLVGGTGKTPIIIALLQNKTDCAVVLRGYARESKGMHIISHKKKILTNTAQSGDEAMMLAQSLPQATVIVSENRALGIQKAKELGCKNVILDDGFSQVGIAKYDILIRPKDEPTNIFCLPSGGYRESKMSYAFADLVLQEGVDFHRRVSFYKEQDGVQALPAGTILLTAISKPRRLLEFLPEQTPMISFPDHHNFTQEEIETIRSKHPNSSLVCTHKDFVKLKKFHLKNLFVMHLDIEFTQELPDLFD